MLPRGSLLPPQLPDVNLRTCTLYLEPAASGHTWEPVQYTWNLYLSLEPAASGHTWEPELYNWNLYLNLGTCAVSCAVFYIVSYAIKAMILPR